jgi:arylsulfatase
MTTSMKKEALESAPNILWICTDQQRFDTLGCYGNPYVNTPHIDALAAQGTLFTHAFAQSPVCTPSRISFLTGRYPRTTRCRQNGQSVPADEMLVTRLFADAGYYTGLSGKLHIAACHPSVCFATEKRINDGYHEFHWSHHPGPDWPTNEYIHWLREKGVRYQTPPSTGSRYVQVGMPEEYHQTTWCVQKAINFIDACGVAKQRRPWLFSVNLFDPHHAFDPPQEHLDRYLNMLDEIPLPVYRPGELDNKPVWQGIDHQRAYGGHGGFPFDKMTETDHRYVRAAYWAMCDLIDSQVGRLLDALEKSGQRDNTLIIFTSDHGEMLGDHGIYLKGPYFYDCAVRVPLIISWPGRIAAGLTVDALVELVDIAPTLLEYAGLPKYEGMQGQSLAPLLNPDAPAITHRDSVYCEFYAANFRYDPPAHTTMLRTERYKLTVAHGQNCGELYDLERDPQEYINLWDHPSYQATKCQLLLQLTDRMAWTVDPLPEREAFW